MKLILLLVIFSNSALAQYLNPEYLFGVKEEVEVEIEKPIVCTEKETYVDPFMVTDASGMGWKTYENFRSKDNYRKKENIIPRRSIVKIKKGSEDYVNSPNSYIPVEVIGVADTDVHDEKLNKGRLRSASGFNKAQKLSKVNIGKKGFLYSKSLKKADDYSYILTEDSPLLADNGLSEMGVVAIQPVTRYDGKYVIDVCCTNTNSEVYPLVKECTTKYKFKLVYADDTQGKEISLDVDACNVASTLVPFKNDAISSMLNFMTLAKNGSTDFDMSKLEYIDHNGMVKIPLDYSQSDGHGVAGPYGSYHYNMDDKGGSDAYAKPLTNCAFMKVLEQHQKECSGAGCQVQFGDMFHLGNWGPHKSHGAGKCIDIRPLKKADDHLSLTYRSKNYDREKTLNFIKLLEKAGGTSILFDDSTIYRDRDVGVSYSGDGSHNNHIHVCFDPDSKNVKKACYKGLAPAENGVDPDE